MRAYRRAWAQATRPWAAFPERAREAPSLKEALLGMLALRLPPAVLSAGLGGMALRSGYAALRDLQPPLAPLLERFSELPPEELRRLLGELPPVPPVSTLLGAALLLAPLWILGAWLHDVVWDHGCLWVLGGVKRTQGWRNTLVAEAEALGAGTFGAWASLLGLIPGVGCLLQPGLLVLALWFWILRGFALAAWHRCPLWKALGATLLHALLFAGFAGLLFLGSFLVLAWAARG